ncbi:hypothetical protein HDV05_000003 [Chytridiales sp. JEL 0842]|nr:hypothetical protein HDV05_000003 [Chytridiales sp. JEL 0842]
MDTPSLTAPIMQITDSKETSTTINADLPKDKATTLPTTTKMNARKILSEMNELDRILYDYDYRGSKELLVETTRGPVSSSPFLGAGVEDVVSTDLESDETLFGGSEGLVLNVPPPPFQAPPFTSLQSLAEFNSGGWSPVWDGVSRSAPTHSSNHSNLCGLPSDPSLSFSSPLASFPRYLPGGGQKIYLKPLGRSNTNPRVLLNADPEKQAIPETTQKKSTDLVLPKFYFDFGFSSFGTLLESAQQQSSAPSSTAGLHLPSAHLQLMQDLQKLSTNASTATPAKEFEGKEFDDSTLTRSASKPKEPKEEEEEEENLKAACAVSTIIVKNELKPLRHVAEEPKLVAYTIPLSPVHHQQQQERRGSDGSKRVSSRLSQLMESRVEGKVGGRERSDSEASTLEVDEELDEEVVVAFFEEGEGDDDEEGREFESGETRVGEYTPILLSEVGKKLAMLGGEFEERDRVSVDLFI